jgi:hypothetical protein
MSWTISLLSMVALSSLTPPLNGAGAPSRESHESRSLQTFDTMYGVDGPFVGEGFPIRGIPGDELPWEVKEARGKLDTDGHLTIRVKGLVFKDAPEVPVELRGKNDESEFRGVVSCWTEEGDQVGTVNVVTPGFPATVSGDSLIRATLNLPDPCVAPIIMVLAGSEDKWFAVTGFESQE